MRAAFPFWSCDLSAPRYILRWIRHGVKFQWIQGRPPAPFSRAPMMVEAPDIDFVISKIQDGIKTGAHGPIPPGHAKWLAPAHVVLTAGKRRLVVNHQDLNDSWLLCIIMCLWRRLIKSIQVFMSLCLHAQLQASACHFSQGATGSVKTHTLLT